MILLIDNYDSFVFNLARYFEELGCETEVVRNDAISIDEIRAKSPAAIVISPGPCTPAEAGVSENVIRAMGATVPILGVCLGHQAIVTALGGRLLRTPHPVHGRVSMIRHAGDGLYSGLSNPLRVTRYHSLIADPEKLPRDLTVTAQTDDGIIMSVCHRDWSLFGVQFHPESVLTDGGHQLLANFLQIAQLPIRNDLPRENQSSRSEKRESGESFPIMRPVHW